MKLRSSNSLKLVVCSQFDQEDCTVTFGIMIPPSAVHLVYASFGNRSTSVRRWMFGHLRYRFHRRVRTSTELLIQVLMTHLFNRGLCQEFTADRDQVLVYQRSSDRPDIFRLQCCFLTDELALAPFDMELTRWCIHSRLLVDGWGATPPPRPQLTAASC
jgi:hypothetical protein